jgi:hypothetical protein
MIRRDVEQQRHKQMQRLDSFELKAAQLNHGEAILTRTFDQRN